MHASDSPGPRFSPGALRNLGAISSAGEGHQRAQAAQPACEGLQEAAPEQE